MSGVIRLTLENLEATDSSLFKEFKAESGGFPRTLSDLLNGDILKYGVNLHRAWSVVKYCYSKFAENIYVDHVTLEDFILSAGRFPYEVDSIEVDGFRVSTSFNKLLLYKSNSGDGVSFENVMLAYVAPIFVNGFPLYMVSNERSASRHYVSQFMSESTEIAHFIEALYEGVLRVMIAYVWDNALIDDFESYQYETEELRLRYEDIMGKILRSRNVFGSRFSFDFEAEGYSFNKVEQYDTLEFEQIVGNGIFLYQRESQENSYVKDDFIYLSRKINPDVRQVSGAHRVYYSVSGQDGFSKGYMDITISFDTVRSVSSMRVAIFENFSASTSVLDFEIPKTYAIELYRVYSKMVKRVDGRKFLW